MHDERENSKKLAAQPSEKSFEQREIKRGTTPYTRSELEQYCEVHSSSPSALCAEIDAYTQKNFELARMIIGSWHASFFAIFNYDDTGAAGARDWHVHGLFSVSDGRGLTCRWRADYC